MSLGDFDLADPSAENQAEIQLFAEELGAKIGQDPEFFAFYRAMQAYETALIGGETSLILSPDSEFFKFFGNIKSKSESQ